MYTIGKFANLSKVSPRMLRHYDKIGLLKPSLIEENGYRYYCDEDMYRISSIKQLRRYEFSLEEIDKILSENNAEYTKERINLKINQLQQSASEYYYLIAELKKQAREIIGTGTILSSNRDFDIVIGQRSEVLALCQRKLTNEENIDRMIDELYDAINKSKDIVSKGAHLTIFHQPYDIYSPDETDIEVCIPVNTEVEEGEFLTRVIEGGLFISTIFIGSYDMIGNGYVALFKWADENNYTITGPTTERYYKDQRDTKFQDQYVTEICVPVKN